MSKPVITRKPEPKVEPQVDPEVEPQVDPKVEPEGPAEDYLGKDHPKLGKWNGHGWSKSN